MLTAGARAEMRANLRLAGPLVLAQLSFMGFGVIDTLMAGHISPTALAAIGVGHNVWLIPFMGFLGLFTAISPIVAQRVGAGQPRVQIGGFARQVMVLAAVLGVAWVFVIRAMARPVLELLGLPEATTELSVQYINAESVAAFAFALCFAQRNVIEGQGFSRPILFTGVCGLVVKVLANVAFVDGRFGAPRLGVVGCGWGTVVSTAVMALVYAIQLETLPRLRELRVYRAWPRFTPGLLEIFRVGLPISFMFMAEGSLFGVAALMMARFGELPIAAHQVAINVASVVFMVPMGLGMATTVRVGQAAGAGHHAAARLAGHAGMALGLCFALLSAATIGLWPGAIASLYTSDPVITPYALVFLRCAALFQLFDCLQVTASGALRGLKDTRAPMAITLAAYWAVGFPIAWGLGFHTAIGPVGIWYGFIGGLAVAAGGLAARFHLKR